MKKILITTLVLLTLMLTACGSASNGPQTGSASQSLSTQMELIIGSLKLEDTDQAITKEQAIELLPLWQTMSQLQNSNTAAQQEIDALFDQIRDTMTSEQIQTIAAMKLTSQDAFAIAQQPNGSTSSSQTTSSGQSNASGGFAPPDGGAPAGGLPGGDPMGGMTGGSTSQTSTQTVSGQSAHLQSGAANQIPPGSIDTLIQLLEKKAAS